MRKPIAQRLKRQLLCAVLGGSLLVIAGCKVGPNYHRPPTPIKPDWSIGYQPTIAYQPSNLASWWEHFQDPVLTGLILQARQQNLTLREAGERIQEARARRAVAAGNLFPQAQAATGAYSKSKISPNVANFFEFPGVFDPELQPENWQLGLQTAWELDFWGRYRRLIEAADAAVGEAESTYNDAMVLLTAEVAQAYIEHRTYEARIEYAKRNLEIQRKTLAIAVDKKEAGIASAIDTSQAASITAQTESVLPQLEILRRQTAHRLCGLLGLPPFDISTHIGLTAQLPQAPVNLAFGIPADLLRRRPDVRRAEYRLAGQSAKIGVAEAEFYPHISLTGSIGYSAEDFSNLFQRRSTTALISPGFSWNILQYGRIKNNVEAEKFAFCSLAAAYQQSIIDAQRETEDAQVAYVLGFHRVEALSRSADEALKAVEKSQASYEEGVIDYGRVYVLQGELLNRQDQLVQAESEVLISLIGIFKALGGGWECSSTAAQIDISQQAIASEAIPVHQNDVPLDHSIESASPNNEIFIIPEEQTIAPVPNEEVITIEPQQSSVRNLPSVEHEVLNAAAEIRSLPPTR